MKRKVRGGAKTNEQGSEREKEREGKKEGDGHKAVYTYSSSVDENISTVGINGESFLKASLALLSLKVSSKYPSHLEQCVDVHL